MRTAIALCVLNDNDFKKDNTMKNALLVLTVSMVLITGTAKAMESCFVSVETVHAVLVK